MYSYFYRTNLLVAVIPQIWLYKQEKHLSDSTAEDDIDYITTDEVKTREIPLVCEPEAQAGEKEVTTLLPLSASFVIVPTNVP